MKQSIMLMPILLQPCFLKRKVMPKMRDYNNIFESKIKDESLDLVNSKNFFNVN